MNARRLNRDRLVVLFLALVLPVSSAVAGPVKLDLERDCRKSWDAITRYIYGRRVSGRTEKAFNQQAGITRDDRDVGPTGIILRRTEALLEDLQRMGPTRDLGLLAARLDELRKLVAASEPKWGSGPVEVIAGKRGGVKTEEGKVVLNENVRYPLFRKIYRLQREIALANPLLDFDDIVFLKRHPAAYSHMVDQIFGITQAPGGGLYVLEDAFKESPNLRNLLEDAVVQNGRLKGKKLEPGAFLSPDVSYDGKEIVFSYVEIDSIWPEKWNYQPEDWSKTTCFHIFKVNIDGTNLRMLTDGPYNDTDPCFLPNGRICFISDRRGGQGRCHPGRNCPTYTLHSMLPDGSDITPLSYHETNEWHPSVNNHGEIVYTRWDYVDRAVTAGQMPWVTKPDGRDARAIHGNYDEAKPTQGEWDPVAIPGNDSLYVATLSMHHNQSYGTFSIFDAGLWDHEYPDKVVRYLTPEEGGGHGDGAYATPWPLSENYYLCVYSPLTPGFWNGGDGKPYDVPVTHGIYLLDAFGNRVLLYRDPEIGCHSPMPLESRPMPPRLPHMTEHAFPPDRQTAAPEEVPEMSTVAVMDVYNSLFPWPAGRKISSLRIVQLYPKPTIGQNNPRIGYATMMNARRSLGTVPVEDDGSAHFELPPRVPVYFQALDEDGLAVQSMKSAVYTHPGEMLTCQGCHEPKTYTPLEFSGEPDAMSRAPSRIQKDVSNAEPFTFSVHVQPVLDARCVGCHTKHEEAPDLSGEKRKGWWPQVYTNLEEYAWYVSGRKDEYRFEAGQRSVPGEVGAVQSRLYQMLTAGSHKDRVDLTEQEMERITLWLDLNSPCLGAYENVGQQVQGELVWPELE